MNAFERTVQFSDLLNRKGYQPKEVERPYTYLRDSIWGQQLYMSLDEAEMLHKRMLLGRHREELLSMGMNPGTDPDPKPKKDPVVDKDTQEKADNKENQKAAEEASNQQAVVRKNVEKATSFRKTKKPNSQHEKAWEEHIRNLPSWATPRARNAFLRSSKPGWKEVKLLAKDGDDVEGGENKIQRLRKLIDEL